MHTTRGTAPLHQDGRDRWPDAAAHIRFGGKSKGKTGAARNPPIRVRRLKQSAVSPVLSSRLSPAAGQQAGRKRAVTAASDLVWNSSMRAARVRTASRCGSRVADNWVECVRSLFAAGPCVQCSHSSCSASMSHHSFPVIYDAQLGPLACYGCSCSPQ